MRAGIEEFDGRDTLVVAVGVPEIVTVNVTVPTDASAGAHAITLRAEDYHESAHVSTVALELEVSQSHGFSLLLVSGPATAAPGGEANWLVDLRNSGNGNDSATFTLEGLPAGWNVSFTLDSTTLGAGESAAIVDGFSTALEEVAARTAATDSGTRGDLEALDSRLGPAR